MACRETGGPTSPQSMPITPTSVWDISHHSDGFDLHEIYALKPLDELREALHNGANPDERMALVEAVRFGSSPQVQALLRAGASVHNFDDDGLSMLHLAVTRNQVKAAGLLLDAGADPDYSPRCGRSPRSQAYTPQMMAVFTAHDLRKRLGKSAMSAPCKVPRRL